MMQICQIISDYLERNSIWPMISVRETNVVLRGIEKDSPLMDYVRHYCSPTAPDTCFDTEKFLNGEYQDAMKILAKIGGEWPLVRVDGNIITVTWSDGPFYKEGESCYWVSKNKEYELADPALFDKLLAFLDGLKPCNA